MKWNIIHSCLKPPTRYIPGLRHPEISRLIDSRGSSQRHASTAASAHFVPSSQGQRSWCMAGVFHRVNPWQKNIKGQHFEGKHLTVLNQPWNTWPKFLTHEWFWRELPCGHEILYKSHDIYQALINGRSSGPNLWRYVSTIFLAIFWGDIPWNLGLGNRPYIWSMVGTSNLGSWNGHRTDHHVPILFPLWRATSWGEK